MKIARRFAGISASPTMAVMQEAQRLKKEGVDVIDFGPGEPDFPTPEPIKKAGIAAIEEDFTRYTASAGIPELRGAVAEKLNSQWGSRYSAANVVISAGAKQSIYNLCMTLFEEGDEVLVPVPAWVTFPEVIKMTGARVKEFVTPESEGFVMTPEGFRRQIGPDTRGVILNTPNNPTGAVIPGSMLKEIVGIAKEHGVFVLFDETYEYFTYGDEPHVSVASLVDSEDDLVAVIGSLSKTYSMTGWRIGYCVTHRKIASKMNEFQSHSSGNPTSISQKAALAALAADPSIVEAMREEYRLRREFVLSELETMPGVSCVRPDGAFYVFPNVERCLGRTGIADSQAFAAFLLEDARVTVVPGSAFGLEGYVRISYATSRENLKEGLKRMRESVTRLLAESGSAG